jgi:hypothetical protein
MKGGSNKNKMTTLKQYATDYVPTQMNNIADLEVVRTDVEIKEETRTNKEGEDYKVKYIVVDGSEYRVPATVIEQIQTIIKAKPDLTSVKVSKSGTGLGTKYQVIPL